MESARRSEALREEMELHLEEKAAELQADGMTAERARAEARRRFGNAGLKHEESREILFIWARSGVAVDTSGRHAHAEEWPGGDGPRCRAQHVLVVAQIAMSFVILVAAGLFVQTLNKLHSVQLGYARENILLFSLNARQAGIATRRLPLFTRNCAGASNRSPE